MKKSENRMLIIECDGSTKEVTPKNGKTLELEEVQQIIGGYIEVVRISDRLILIIDEEGKLKGLQPNAGATVMAVNADAISKHDCIVGRAVLCPSEMLP